MSAVPKVYAAIAAVMADLSSEGIAKTGKNTQQGYAFRGIDQVYNTLSSVLSKHGLLMLPKALSRECVERQTKSGGALFYSTVHMEFTLVAAEDGSSHVIQTYGEAMDSADKSTNKAMSAAYKYAAMQAFCIPTEGDNDADATTHEVKAANSSAAPNGLGTAKRDTGPGSIDGKDWWGAEGPGSSPAQAKRDGLDTLHDKLLHEASEQPNIVALREWCETHGSDIKQMPRAWRTLLREAVDGRLAELGGTPNERKAA